MFAGYLGWLLAMIGLSAAGSTMDGAGTLVGHVLDDDTGRYVAARVYLVGSDGEPCFPTAGEGESVVRYDVTRGVREAYATIGPHPFRAELPAGTCTVTIELGKEYVPLTREITIPEGDVVEETFRMRRLFDMTARGWYSGDLHVHTDPKDLPNVQLAEDLNVAFPLTAWAMTSDEVPENSFGGPVPPEGRYVPIDETHGYWNLNTEYEIFTVDGQGWVLGSIMILGHTEPFTMTAPPVTPIVEEARRQGCILDLEKASWPWSTMLVPVAGMDTMELSNNHMWRLKPYFGLHDVKPPEWMHCTEDAAGWAEFGFQTYYAFLNSGFRIAPSAGTANGVHPVPLAHSRAYVKIDGDFSYEKWIEGLRRGRSFATNGPMLFLEVDGMLPGDERTIDGDDPVVLNVSLEAMSVGKLDRVELIINAGVAERFNCPNGSHSARFQTEVEVTGSSWIAARCFEVPPEDNVRFAHTGPIYFHRPNRPLKPDRRQIEYLIDTVQSQLDRGKGPLPEELMDEYRRALEAYQLLLK